MLKILGLLLLFSLYLFLSFFEHTHKILASNFPRKYLMLLTQNHTSASALGLTTGEQLIKQKDFLHLSFGLRSTVGKMEVSVKLLLGLPFLHGNSQK